ncbi:hypothetical protein D3C79_669180 [compost metagenome]
MAPPGLPTPLMLVSAISTWLVGMRVVVWELSDSVPPVRLVPFSRTLAVTLALLPMVSPSLISLWGLPAGGV